MLIERTKEIFTNPIPYIFLIPLVFALLSMVYLRIRILFAKKNGEIVTVKIIKMVEREGKGNKFGYDAVVEITTKEGIIFENIFLSHKISLNKEMAAILEKGSKKNFLSIEKFITM
jgi:hypothetical protein